MEILLVIALIAVAGSALYVATTLNSRTQKNIAPLVDGAAGKIRNTLEATSGELRQRIEAIADQLQGARELVNQIEATNNELRQQVQAITFEVRQGTGLAKHLGERVATQQIQLSRDLLQLDHRAAQFCESLAQQSAQIAEIHNSIRRVQKQAERPSGIDSLVMAMLEAESHAEINGWGKPPQLYALINNVSSTDKNRELAAERREARPEVLIPVEREPLPEGNLIEALASIHWPQDVVGCVLVTELADLRLRGEDRTFVDNASAGQWASTHPDGRPARLAIGVRRDGEHTYGLRIKGEDDVQVRADLAEDLVTALRRTF
jgi:uncharacterized protein YoxC